MGSPTNCLPAQISWNRGESDRAFAALDRAESVLRQLVASYPGLPNYRSDLATTIRIRVLMDSEIGRERGGEARLREAVSIAESVLRDDPDQIWYLEAAGAVYSDLATTLGRRGQGAEARTLFVRALDRLDQARARSPRDARIRRLLARALAARAEFMGRLGQLGESLDDWDRATTLATDIDILEFRLGRATSLARSSDYRSALADVTAADRSIDDRANLRIGSALSHAALSDAIRRDRSLTRDVRRRVCRHPAYRGFRADWQGKAITGLSRSSTTISSALGSRFRPSARRALLPTPHVGSRLSGATVRSRHDDRNHARLGVWTA